MVTSEMLKTVSSIEAQESIARDAAVLAKWVKALAWALNELDTTLAEERRVFGDTPPILAAEDETNIQTHLRRFFVEVTVDEGEEKPKVVMTREANALMNALTVVMARVERNMFPTIYKRPPAPKPWEER